MNKVKRQINKYLPYQVHIVISVLYRNLVYKIAFKEFKYFFQPNLTVYYFRIYYKSHKKTEWLTIFISEILWPPSHPSPRISVFETILMYWSPSSSVD